MVAAALEALVGETPGDEALTAAVSTIPAGELPGALRLLARNHGAAAIALLRWCLGARSDWAIAAAGALGSIPSPEAAAALAEAEAAAPARDVRREIRRALYRLRQGGVTPPAAPVARPAPPGPAPRQAWVSAVDGTGSRGVWVVLEAAHGERVLLTAIVNDGAGLLDFVGGPIAKKRLDARLRSLREESPLPWVEAPAAWALHLLAEASGRGGTATGEVARWRAVLAGAGGDAAPPIYARWPAAEVAADPAALERSAEVLGLPELASWFLDPPSVQAEALELLQAQESRLVVSDQVKEERRAAIVDRVIEARLDEDGRRLWRARLEEQAWVLLETGRAAEARAALAAAVALGDPAIPARRIPFARALAERSLHVAGEVTLGRLPAEGVRRIPRPIPARP